MELKRLLSLAGILIGLAVHAANPTFNSFDPFYFGNSNNQAIYELIRSHGTNVIVIDNVIGNDTLASNAVYTRPWKTAFDLQGANVQFGAIPNAAQGDLILFMPSTTPYLVPSIPLSMRGLSLMIPEGVIMQRTNFFNGQPSDLTSAGPLIIPGTNSQVFVNGLVIATNTIAADAFFGWNYASTSAGYGISNNIGPTNVVLEGTGTTIGSSDGVYITTAFGGNLEIRRLKIRTMWDGLFFNDSYSIPSLGTLPMSVVTRNLDVLTTTNANASQLSHGVVDQCSLFTDYGSVFTAYGGTASQGNNSALEVLFTTSAFLTNGSAPLQNGTIVLRDTTLATAGDNTNVIPLFLNGGIVLGSWSENTQSNSWTTFNANDYIGTSVTTNYNVDTNYIKSVVVPGSGAASGPLHWNGGIAVGGGAAYTNVNGNQILFTNWVAGNSQEVRVRNSTGVVIYTGNQGFFGLLVITNTGIAPPPIYGASNNLAVVVSKVTLGQIIQTNWVDGAKNTNNTGRPIQVRAQAFATPASAAGLAAEDLQVDQTQSGTFTILSRIGEQTIIGTIANTNYGTLNAYIMTNGVFTFTNSSTGAGNSAGVLSGSGQRIIQ